MSYLSMQEAGPNTTAFKPSIYEHIVSGGLSEEMLQHKVYHFSGSDLDSEWTFTDHLGTGSGAMNDAVDGGYTITSDSTTFDNSSINFNDINHYSHNSSVIISSFKRDGTDSWTQTMLVEQLASLSDTGIQILDDTDNTYKQMNTRLNGSGTAVDSSVVIDTLMTTYKLELKASSCVAHINGTLEIIKTTDLPDVALQPVFRVGTRTTAAKTGSIRYMEAYNT